MPTTLWVDADACPVAIREILYRAANRTQIPLVLVSNQWINVPQSPHISHLRVPQGPDVADHEIVRRSLEGDLVITSDIPLADELIAKGVAALSSRGERFTRENIKARLNIRDFMETLRSSGTHTGGPSALGPKEKQAFANELDRWLSKARANPKT